LRGKIEECWLSQGIGNKMRCLIIYRHLLLPISCLCDVTWWLQPGPERLCPSCRVGQQSQGGRHQLCCWDWEP